MTQAMVWCAARVSTQVTMTTPSQATVTASVIRGNSQTPMSYTIDLTQYNGSMWLVVTASNQ